MYILSPSESVMANTQLILHVPGTEKDTTALPKKAVREGIAQGQIKYSQLIWSPVHEAWKQVRELPHLWPSQKLAPAPAPRVTSSVPIPRVSTPVAVPITPKVRVAVAKPRVQAPPKISLRASADVQPEATVPRIHENQPAPVPVAVPVPMVRAAAVRTESDHLVVEEESGPPFVKWICIGVGSLLVLILGGNYLMVGHPVASRLAQTSYGKVSVYSHLGAFMQPGDLALHVPASSELNESNFAGFLVALAQSSSSRPFGGEAFERVSLTPGWTGRYSFDGQAWRDLGKMGGQDAQTQKDFILNQVDDASGQPLAGTTTDEGAREKVWEKFVQDFSRS